MLLFTEPVLRDGSVLPLLREWRQRPQPPRLLLGMALPLQPTLVATAWRAGVDALLCREDYGRGELARALEVVTQGRRYRGPPFTPSARASQQPLP